jgi:hypothetical protein
MFLVVNFGVVAMSFQFVGFLLAYLFSTTHAGKMGARTGLGLAMINYGVSIPALVFY